MSLHHRVDVCAIKVGALQLRELVRPDPCVCHPVASAAESSAATLQPEHMERCNLEAERESSNRLRSATSHSFGVCNS